MILVSVFRDSESYLDRYWEQTEMLRRDLTELNQPLRRVMVEGDSSDQTWKTLNHNLQAGDTLLKCEHGGPYYRSQVIPMRWRQLALCCNVAMTAATRDNVHGEAVVYMECDLIWGAQTIIRLLHHLPEYDAVAPLSMQGARFYDIWGYVKNGRRFSPWPPYHPDIAPFGDQLSEIDSAGSCIAMTAEAASVVEFSLTDCIRGVGRSLQANGYSLWLDPTLAVRHP